MRKSVNILKTKKKKEMCLILKALKLSKLFFSISSSACIVQDVKLRKHVNVMDNFYLLTNFLAIQNDTNKCTETS